MVRETDQLPDDSQVSTLWNHPYVSTRERPADRGRRRAREAMRRLGLEHRRARMNAGLSLRIAGDASGAPHQQLMRFEAGLLDRISVSEVGAWCAVVGLDLVFKAYPAGDAIRDASQARLLERLRVLLHPGLRWRTEVGLPIPGDLRAWDALIRGEDWRIGVEAETVLSDIQALERRLALKTRDGGVDHVILLVADTPRNRRARAAAPAAFTGYAADPRAVLSALRTGRDPGRSGIVFR